MNFGPLATKLEILVSTHPKSTCLEDHISTPRIASAHPTGQKRAKFSAIWTTSDFDWEYLQNGWRYLESEN